MSNILIKDFYADWCGPCKMVAPILKEIEEELENVTIEKINVDDNENIFEISKEGIRNIPTLLFYSDGVFKKKHVGASTKDKLMEIIASINE